MNISPAPLTWPPRPYKGLMQYTYNDAPLFAGRATEISSCADKLLRSDLSVFLLHGTTGCGKSSFLQAGLLPFLNSLRVPSSSRQREHSSVSTLLPVVLRSGRVIRSGRRPLETLARATYDLISELRTSEVDFPSSLTKALLGCRSQADFLAKTCANELSLFQALGNVSIASASDKFLLVIDQAEDIFAPGSDEQRRDRERYFRLLAFFSSEPINMKILISLRSDFREKFDRALDEKTFDFARLSRYHLEPIGSDGVVEAILHPTRSEPRLILGQNLGSPLEKYGFQFDNGLPEMIRDDLTTLSDRRLPVLQVICDRLYSHWRERAKKNPSKTRITEADYRVTGAATAQISSHLEEKIVSFFQQKPHLGKADQIDYAGKADQWRAILSRLADTQTETPRAKVAVPEKEILAPARRHGRENPREMLRWLSRDECYVLQPAYPTPDSTNSWRLLHDTLALSLAEWESNKRAGQRCVEQMANESILRAARWGSRDLYSVRPRTVEFHTINDLIWDHQIPLYAQAKGFTERVGLNFEVDHRFDLSQARVGQISYDSFLSSPRRDAHRLLVLPPKLFGPLTSRPWTTVGIPNVYRGFAIIGRKRKDLEPIKAGASASQKESEQRLIKLASVLAHPDTKTLAFEEESRHFVGHILRWAGLSNDMKRIDVRAPRSDRYNRAVDPVFTALVTNECEFALGTAPSRALAEQAGFVVFADFADVEHILRGKDRDKLNTLKLHETWAVDISPDEMPLLMRLASVMLYSVEYVQANPDDFVRFLYNDIVRATADGAYLLQREFIRSAVSSCYRYVPSHQYFFEYLSPISTSRYTLHGSNGASRVFGELMQYRSKCDSILARVGAWSRVPGSVRKDLERATRHYQIFNYYDAYHFLGQAVHQMGHG